MACGTMAVGLPMLTKFTHPVKLAGPCTSQSQCSTAVNSVDTLPRMKPSVDSLPDINECVVFQESFDRDRERGLDLSDCEEEDEFSNESSDIEDSDDDDFSRHLNIEDIMRCKRLLLPAVFVPPDRCQKGCKAMVSDDGRARPDLSENLICSGLGLDTSIDAAAQTSLNTKDGRCNTTLQLPLILDGEDSGKESSEDDSWSNEGCSNKEDNVDNLANCPEASTSESSMRMHCLGAKEMDELLLDAGLVTAEGCLDSEDSEGEFSNCAEISFTGVNCLSEEEMNNLLFDTGSVPTKLCLDPAYSEDSGSSESSLELEDSEGESACSSETCETQFSLKAPCLGDEDMNKLLIDAAFVPTAPTQPLTYRRPVRRCKVYL